MYQNRSTAYFFLEFHLLLGLRILKEHLLTNVKSEHLYVQGTKGQFQLETAHKSVPLNTKLIKHKRGLHHVKGVKTLAVIWKH